ncbi:helix-turn-helix transcriptional regulator [Bradyrhizobium neotropicale]|uniref:helix-turn-helix transcriptional regulator n=1 Tax=Bradyrhizobium neotropicale TaxID=1497615 RepID=UPI003D31F072
MSIREFAQVFNVSVRTIRRLHAKNLGPARFKRGRCLVYLKVEVAAWVAARNGAGHPK